MTRIELRSTDGTLINGRRWSPEGEVKADILLCHGLGEHLGRYEYLGTYFSQRGYRVTGVELRGHGHSAGKRGHVDRWSQYVADLEAGADEIGGPHFVLGHSMGGLVSLDYVRTAAEVTALIVSAPPVAIPDGAPQWKMMLGRVLSRILPRLSMGNEIDPAEVCSDPEVVAAYATDPLVFATITPRWFTEFSAAIERVQAHAPHYRVPMLAMWGSEDVVVNVDAVAEFPNQYGGPVEHKAWDGMRHEIFNEPDKDEVLDTVIGFIEARMNA